MKKANRIPIPVSIGKNSYFSPSTYNADSLIVFVHGFRGKALSTWGDFPKLIEEFDGLRKSDVLYYGYPSRPQRMQNTAINLRSDVDSVWVSKDPFGTEVSVALKAREDPYGWKRVVFVAHSMGAVIVRQALLDCVRSNRKPYRDENHWSKCAALCFFAPAHSGANILKLVGETLHFGKISFTPILELIFPCLQDLDQDSLALKTLRSDYESISDQSRNYVRAVNVVLAEMDRVVDPASFPGDPVSEQINGHGHKDVCKPNEKFLDPVNILLEVFEIKGWSNEA